MIAALNRLRCCVPVFHEQHPTYQQNPRQSPLVARDTNREHDPENPFCHLKKFLADNHVFSSAEGRLTG